MKLATFNNLDESTLNNFLTQCCGSSHWVIAMIKGRPYKNLNHLHQSSDEIWSTCTDEDYLQAFEHHPQIGNIDSLREKFASTQKWAAKEQKGSKLASEDTLKELKYFNEKYLKKFGFIFIVCATGKSAHQMLNLLKQRMSNNPDEEFIIAAREQNKITHLRLDKLLFKEYNTQEE